MTKCEQIDEQSTDSTIVLHYSKCNPPTLDHLIAFSATKQLAENQNADYAILLSNDHDISSGPLTLSQKVEYTNLFFPGFNIVVVAESMKTPVDIARVYSKKYKNLIEVCGVDRENTCKTLHEQFNNCVYEYDSVQVVSTNEVDADNSKTSIKMLKAIREGDVKSLQKYLLAHVREIDAKRFMNDARVGMGLDAIKETVVINTSELRESYIAGEIFLENTFVESDNQLFKIINRNSNYITVSDSVGILSKKWLTNVQPIEVSEATRVAFDRITEMKFSTADKIKVGKIIGGMLGADVSNGSNAEQMVNAGLRITKNKTLNAEAITILQNMLKTADDAGIMYDKKLVPTSISVSEDAVQYSADIKNPEFDPATGKYKRKQHRRRLVFDRTKQIVPDETVSGRTTESLNIIPSTAGSDVQAPQIDQYVEKTPDLNKRKIKTLATLRKESADDVIAAGDQSPAKMGTLLDVPLTKETKKNKRTKMDEAKRRDHEQEHIDSIRARTAQAHLKGQRYRTLYVKDQIIADTHHLHLNTLGGKQVALHPGTSITTHESVDECTVDELEASNCGNDISDAEIDDMIAHINHWDDIVSTYDSSELSYIDNTSGQHVAEVPDKFYGYEGEPTETPDPREVDAPDDVFVAGPPKMRESEELNEIMSRAERIKTDIMYHSNRTKRPVKVVVKKRSTATQLNRKARSLAIKTLKLNLAKKPLKELSQAERSRIEHVVSRNAKLVNRIAIRLLPRIKKIEQTHMTHLNYTKD